MNDGTIAFDGGWRVYSSGAGIALGLIMRRLFGFSVEADALSIDPVMPAALDGLKCEIALLGRLIEVHYRVAKAGCGVSAFELNGDALTLSYAPNPHRRGAARVSKASFTEKLRRERNVLNVSLG